MTSFNVTRSVLAVLVVATIGAALALQGWRSRIPNFDLLLSMNGAIDLVANQRIPDRGALASFASYNPPGGAWLMAPGVLLFKDPRLFEFIGSVTLYAGTLVGIFWLARIYFGISCAILAVILYGLSELGLYVAGSIWERFPLHFFYVWMVYWTVQWVRRKNAIYLAAATVTWASGMYVFMEIAPAFFILPVVWLLYRPPVNLKPLLLAGIFSLAMWLPYLQFEFSRSFADLRSQLSRQNILPSNYQGSWCDDSLILRNTDLENTSSPEDPINVLNGTSKVWSNAVMRISPLWERANFAAMASFSNLRLATNSSAIGVVLMCMVVVTVFALGVPQAGIAKAQSSVGKSLWYRWITRFAVGICLLGFLFNEFTIARYLSLDGSLEAQTVAKIRSIQILLILSGVALLISKSGIPVLLKRLINPSAIPPGTDTLSQEHPRLLVIALIVPWVILLLLVEDESHWERFWWLWPLQVVTLAASVTYVLRRWRAPPVVIWAGTAFLLVLTVGNPFLRSKLQAWHTTGWSGPDAESVQAVNYVASRLKGRTQAAVGYQFYIWAFMAKFNVADPRYKVGANIDLLFQYLHGISNSNLCAEGVSSADEFRIVKTRRSGTDPRAGWYFDFPIDRRFHLARQFGSYQVFERVESFQR